jgi:hypothetical protein
MRARALLLQRKRTWGEELLGFPSLGFFGGLRLQWAQLGPSLPRPIYVHASLPPSKRDFPSIPLSHQRRRRRRGPCDFQISPTGREPPQRSGSSERREMSYMRGDLLTKMRKLVKGLARPEPRWLKAMEESVLSLRQPLRSFPVPSCALALAFLDWSTHP